MDELDELMRALARIRAEAEPAARLRRLDDLRGRLAALAPEITDSSALLRMTHDLERLRRELIGAILEVRRELERGQRHAQASGAYVRSRREHA